MPKRSTSTSDASREAKTLKMTREEEKKRAREWALNQKSNKKAAVERSPVKVVTSPSSSSSSGKSKNRKELLDARSAEIAAAQSWVKSQIATEISSPSSSKKSTKDVIAHSPKGRQSRKPVVESVPSRSPSPSPPNSPQRRPVVTSSSSSKPKSKPKPKSKKSYDSDNEVKGDEVKVVKKSSGGGLNFSKPVRYINAIGRQISSMMVFCACVLFFLQWIYVSYTYYAGNRIPAAMLLESGSSVVAMTFLFFVPFMLMVVPSYMLKKTMKCLGEYVGEGVAAFIILVGLLIYFPGYGISNWDGVWPF